MLQPFLINWYQEPWAISSNLGQISYTAASTPCSRVLYHNFPAQSVTTKHVGHLCEISAGLLHATKQGFRVTHHDQYQKQGYEYVSTLQLIPQYALNDPIHPNVEHDARIAANRLLLS